MVLFAVVLLVQVETADSRESNPQRLRLQNAVIQLSSDCLTSCHSSATAPVNQVSFHGATLPALYDDASPPLGAFAVSIADNPRVHLDTKLRALGTRLLDSPAAQEQPYVLVVAEFLRAYEEARNTTNLVSQLRARQAFDGIEHWLTWLEHQAQSPEWSEAPNVPVKGAFAALSTSPSAPHAVAYASHEITALHFKSEPHSRCEDEQVIAQHPAVRLAYRRGPPAGVAVSIGVGEEMAVG